MATSGELPADEEEEETNDEDDVEENVRRAWEELMEDPVQEDQGPDKAAKLKVEFPLKRVQKVMKCVEGVQGTTKEAAALAGRACEMLVLQLTCLSWAHTKARDERTLRYCDVATACIQTQSLDYLADLVPKAAEDTAAGSLPSEPLTQELISTSISSSGGGAQVRGSDGSHGGSSGSSTDEGGWLDWSGLSSSLLSLHRPPGTGDGAGVGVRRGGARATAIGRRAGLAFLHRNHHPGGTAADHVSAAMARARLPRLPLSESHLLPLLLALPPTQPLTQPLPAAPAPEPQLGTQPPLQLLLQPQPPLQPPPVQLQPPVPPAPGNALAGLDAIARALAKLRRPRRRAGMAWSV